METLQKLFNLILGEILMTILAIIWMVTGTRKTDNRSPLVSGS